MIVRNVDLARLFDRQAKRYDLRGQKDERRVTPLVRIRKMLLAKASGRVLEAAVGAGANFPHYPALVHVTAVDISPEMVARARQAAERHRVTAEFYVEDLERMEFPEDAFDTVVSTLSLCGYADPVDMLRKFRRWCRPQGRILLLEHGAASFAPLRLLQHGIDPLQVRKVGCHADRDILAIARAADLRMLREERKFLGALYVIEAEP